MTRGTETNVKISFFFQNDTGENILFIFLFL